MANESKHLIQAIFQVKNWNLYKQTVNKSGKIVSQVYKKQVREGNRVIDNTKRISGANTRLTQTFTKATSKQNDLVRALKRAAIVAPVWLILRSAMMKVLSSIKDIINTYKELDMGMRKVMAVATWSGQNQEKIYSDLEARARGYFGTTAKGMKDITEAMYQLGTAGRSTEEIMEGFEHVMNLAIGTFGNVATSGRIVAGILNVFEKQLMKVGGTSEQLRYISDLLASAWKNNQIELSELNTAMGYLSSVGSALNMSLQELVASASVMSDALLRGGKGGRLLARSFVEIVKDSKKLRDLGVIFDPYAPLNFYDVMKQLHQIYVEQAGSMGFVNDLVDIFGVRGVRAVLSVLQQWEKFNKELARTPEELKGTAESLKELAEGSWWALMAKRWHQIISSPEIGEAGSLKKGLAEIVHEGEKADKKITELNTAIAKLGKTVNVTKREAASMIAVLQTKNLHKLAKRLGKQYEINTLFIKATTGAMKEGEETLERIVKQSKAIEAIGLEKHFKISAEIETGNIQQEMSRYKSMIAVQGTPKIEVSDYTDAIRLLMDIAKQGQNVSDISKQNLQAISEITGKTGQELEKGLQLRIEELKTVEGMKIAVEGLGKLEKQRLEDLKLSIEYEKQKIKSVSETSILMSKLTKEVNRQNETIKNYNREHINDKRELITIGDILSLNAEKLRKSLVERKDATKLLNDGKKITISAFKEENSIAKMMIKHQMNLLGLTKATDRAKLETKIVMEKELGINQSKLSLLKNELALNIAIKKEKESQVKLSSDTMKLYEISKKYGIGKARDIGQFLQGKTTYKTFKTRDAFKVFETEFSDLAKTMKVLSEGVKGQFLRGVPIEEEGLRQPSLVGKYKAKRAAQAVSKIAALPQAPIVSPKVDINTTIQQIQIKLPEGSLDRMAEETGKQVIDKLKNDESLRKLLAKALRPFI